MLKVGTLLNSYTWVLCSRLHSWCGRVVLRHSSHRSSGLLIYRSSTLFEFAWSSKSLDCPLHCALMRFVCTWNLASSNCLTFACQMPTSGTLLNRCTWVLCLWVRSWWVGIERLFCLLLGHPLRRSNWLLIYHPLASWSLRGVQSQDYS